MSKYAEGTSVPISRSRDELERTLERFGATAQAWQRDDELGKVALGFRRNGKTYRFIMGLMTAEETKLTPTGRKRYASTAQGAADQENRRRFRSLAQYVKALMDAADTGIINSEEALLPYLILPGGSTVAETISPHIVSIIESGHVNIARLLPAQETRG